MFKNRLYDLVFESMIPLPGYYSSLDSPPDVTVRYGNVVPCPLLQTSSGLNYLFEKNRCILSWSDTAAFQIDDGSQITVQPFGGTSETVLSLPLVGPVSSILLMKRGVLTLHGSAVAVNDNALLFIGNKGQGKSTLASHLLDNAGATLLTDDLAAIDIKQTGNFIRPGFPALKLWPDSLCHLNEDINQHPRITPDIEKRQLSLTNRFHPHVTRISAIFLLNIDDDLSIRRLSFQESCMALFSNTFGCFFAERTSTAAVTFIFNQCGQLAKTTPVYLLTRPHNFSRLPETISTILNQ
ncbi:MAG: hypothetical protein Q7W05_15260 [Deltaproteobacteria bacterium]|jgi:hypothetical protein|nr:hypothetical protein [Deltaproteobacteria bacterium]